MSNSLSVQQLVESVFHVLNVGFEYAVLRGYEELPYKLSGHDIDILITRDSFKRFKPRFLDVLETHDVKVMMINKNERFTTIVVSKLFEGQLVFLYLDFFFNYSLFGTQFMSAKEVLARRIYNGRIYHVTLLDEYLEKLLNTKLLGREYPSKYKAVEVAVLSGQKQQLDVMLAHIFGAKINRDAIQKDSARMLRRRALMRSVIRNPFRALEFKLRFATYYLLAWAKPKGFSISFSGPDGVGKTTVLEGVASELGKPFRELTLFHFRPNLVPRLAEVGQKCGVTKEVDCDYGNPHRGAKTGVISSLIRLAYYIFDYNLGYLKLVKPTLFRRGVVIFDRYYTDVATDSQRSRIHLNYKLVFYLRRLVPRLDYNFLVVAAPEAILKRKQELTIDQIEDILGKIQYLSDAKEYCLIENNGTAEEAVSKILNHISGRQHEKNVRFFDNLNSAVV